MRFALALATIATVAIAGTPAKKDVDFGASLNSQAAWGSFKEKTVAHGNASNKLMDARNTAVKAWFAAKTASATAGAASTKAAAKAASKLAPRNTATKNSVDAGNALTKANGEATTAKGLWTGA